jgi:glycosyltransferase involved in cell wall biosynthesis
LSAFFEHASECSLRVTVICAGPREAIQGSVRFLPITTHAPTELAFVRQLRRRLVSGELNFPAGAVVLANTELYAWAFRGLSFPIVLMSHGAVGESLRLRYSRLFVRLYRFLVERSAVAISRRIVAVSPRLREFYLNHYPMLPPSMVQVVPVGVDLREFEGRPRSNPLGILSLGPDATVILFVGRLYPEKNLPLFIAACDNLRGRGKTFEAVVVGDGVESLALAKAATTRPWLHWIPKMSRSDVLDAVALARVVVICSRHEAGPLILLEALGSGTAVVTTDVGRARELVTDAVGRIVRANPASCADGIQDMLFQSPTVVYEASKQIWARIDFRDTMNSLVEILRVAGRPPGPGAPS